MWCLLEKKLKLSSLAGYSRREGREALAPFQHPHNTPVLEDTFGWTGGL